MREGRLGCITTPKQGNRIPDGSWWCADNGKFGKGWPGESAWFAWLSRAADDTGRGRLLFATAPDVVGDSENTLRESLPFLPKLRELSVPSAFVAQDGCSRWGLIPWGEFDVLFIGGTDEFKLGEEGALVCEWARELGVPTHMGRVNSRKRIQLALDLGCATVDGTYLSFGPDVNLLRLIGFFNQLGLNNFEGWSFSKPLDTGFGQDVVSTQQQEHMRRET